MADDSNFIDERKNDDKKTTAGDRDSIYADDRFEELGKIAPHSPEAEVALLGSIILDNDCMHEVAQRIKPEDFYLKRHQRIYEAILMLYDKSDNIDYVTLDNVLKSTHGNDEAYGGLDYLTELPGRISYIPSVSNYVEIIRRHSVRRMIIRLSRQYIEKAYDSTMDVSETLDRLEAEIFSITQGDFQSEVFSMKDILGRILQNLKMFENSESTITGMPSGFSRLDELTAGFQRGELIIVAARPSMGKTTLALNIARHVAVEINKSVAFFSCEMSNEQIVKNLLSAQARIDSSRIRLGNFRGDDYSRFSRATGELGEAPLYIDDTPGISLRELAAKTRRLVAQYDIQMVVVDYLQLMSPPKLNKNSNREQEISTISRGLKALAREMKIPVIVLSQLNRDVEKRQGKQGTNKPRMSDLRESGSIEQDADVIILLHRDFYYTRKEEDQNKATLIVAKQRNGPTSDVDVAYRSNYMLFDNMTTQYGDDDVSPPFDDYTPENQTIDEDMSFEVYPKLSIPTEEETDDDNDEGFSQPFDNYDASDNEDNDF